MAIRPKELPEKSENWAEADFRGHAKSVVTVKSGHTVIVDEPRRLGGSLAGCTAVIVDRVARDMKPKVESLKVKSTIVYSPRGIAGQEGCPSQPIEAASGCGFGSTRTPGRSRRSRRTAAAAVPAATCSRRPGAR